MTQKRTLDEIAIVHSGDKGDGCNVAVIPYRYDDYEMLREQISAQRIQLLYGECVKGEVVRYELPGTKILNFWMNLGNDGGSSRSLIVDRHAIARSSLALILEIEVPDDWEKPVLDKFGRITN